MAPNSEPRTPTTKITHNRPNDRYSTWGSGRQARTLVCCALSAQMQLSLLKVGLASSPACVAGATGRRLSPKICDRWLSPPRIRRKSWLGVVWLGNEARSVMIASVFCKMQFLVPKHARLSHEKKKMKKNLRESRRRSVRCVMLASCATRGGAGGKNIAARAYFYISAILSIG